MRLLHPSRTLVVSTLAAALFFGTGERTTAQAQEVIPKLISEMEAVFGETSRMIDHTMTVLGHAEEISTEEGGDPLVVRASAIFHDVGIPQAREIHGSSSGQFQEIEGPPIAREILTKHGVAPEAVDHICGIHNDSRCSDKSLGNDNHGVV